MKAPPELPISGRWGLRIPGCLTSEDEERETWTAESLRVSNTWKLRFSNVRGRTKTSAVHVLHRLHHRCPRCESQAACWLRLTKNGGTSSNVVISRFKVQVQLESLILAQSERWRQA